MTEKHGGPAWKAEVSGLDRDAIGNHAKTFGVNMPMDTPQSTETARHRVLYFRDALGGASGGKYGCGHDRSYYKKEQGRLGLMETYANLYTGIVNKWPEYENAFPLTTAWMKRKLGL